MPKKRRRGGARYHHVAVAPRAGGGLALEVNGVVQSVTLVAADPGYWAAMIPEDCPRRALLLGLGGGTVALALARRRPDAEIMGIEHDPFVVTLAREHFGLDGLPQLTIVQDDAFRWVETQQTDEAGRFDLICLDLYDAGRLAPGALATPFLRQLAALLAPGGALTVNLMADGRLGERLHRLRHVFRVERETHVRGNLVAHLRTLASVGEADAGTQPADGER